MKRRLLSTVAVLGFFGVTVVLLLSDRAPLVFPMLSSGIRTVGRRVEAITGIDVIDREQIPFDTDLLGHATLWFCGMVVVGFALRKKIPTLLTAIVMIAIGIGFEFGQFYWTQSRHLSVDDAIANAVGIVAGAIVVMVIGGTIDIISYVRRWMRRRATWVSESPLTPTRGNDWPQLEPTAAHEPVTQSDPWIPPGFASPSYPAASAPTWRYGSAAQGTGTDGWSPAPSVAPPATQTHGTPSPWAPPRENPSPWAPPQEPTSLPGPSRESRSPWAPPEESHAPRTPTPSVVPTGSAHPRPLQDITNEHPVR